MRPFILSIVVLAFGLVKVASSPGQTVSTNLPLWRANSSLVSLRGIIWNERIVAKKPFEISLIVKNISTKEVFALRRYNGYAYSFTAENRVASVIGDEEGASADEDFVRLKPGEVMAFSHLYIIQHPGRGRFRVSFHNNMLSEEQVAPARDGIPVVNDVECDLGNIVVEASNPYQTRAVNK